MNPATALNTTAALGFRAQLKRREYLAAGAPLDALIQGFPRGAIGEITGPDSSGRTAMALSALAAATRRLEICAYVDATDSFDPCSAAAAGIALERLVWVRCGGNAGHAMKAVDNLLHAGGFGVVVLDLCDIAPQVARRIPISYWYRFRLAIENTPAILLLLEREPLAKSCAALMLDMKRNRAVWSGAPGFKLFRGIEAQVRRRKPVDTGHRGLRSQVGRINSMFACLHRETAATALPAVAESFAPVFEMSGPGTVVFDIGGLRRLYGSPRDIAEAIAKRAGEGANVAVAANVETAILAARNFKGITVIRGDEAEALGPLGIETLPLTPEMWETLDSWGIRTLADFANLPPLGIAARLGPEGVQLQDVARGAMERPLRLHQPCIPYRDRIELEHPVELLEPLLFLIARILNDLCARLESQALAASEISVHLDLENKTAHARTLRLPLPTRDSRSILKLLQLDLEAHPPAAPMMAVSLALEAVQPRRVQRDIFLPPTPEPDKLELTLARIRAFAGEENVGVPELLNTHRPRPFQLAARAPAMAHEAASSAAGAPPRSELKIAMRFFRPPVAASVRCEGPRPMRVDASDIHGSVVIAAGPWRTSGEWWTTDPWSRDEWDIALSNEKLYRIYCEPSRKWFVEALYD